MSVVIGDTTFNNDTTKINLYNRGLISLPVEIGNLVNLQSLHLSYNQLTSLPVEIGNLVNLEILYLDQNQLTSLPVEIGKLLNLKELYLDNNCKFAFTDNTRKFTKFPISTGRLVN